MRRYMSILVCLLLAACQAPAPEANHHAAHRRTEAAPVVPSAGPPASAPADASPLPDSIHLALGRPAATHALDLGDAFYIDHGYYVTMYSHKLNGPSWSAWRLTRQDFGGTARHKGNFLKDDTLPAGWYRVSHQDYTDSGYDRGHLVRSEDRTSSDAANASTFILSNVLPQRHDLNAGPWLRLEDHCRVLAQHDGRQLYIVAGGIYGTHPATIGHGLVVPDAFWKVVVVLAPGEAAADVTSKTPVIAVVMPNVEGILNDPWAKYRSTLADVERRSGYRFLTALPESVHSALQQAQ